MEKKLLFIITWGTYLVMFTPLIFNTRFFFPFVAPKTIFFRIFVEIIFAAWLLLVMLNRRYRPRLTYLTVALALFLAVFILASFTGDNLSRSFWSTNERMTGIWTMAHLFAFFLVLSSVFLEKRDWERILGVSVAVGTILSLYIILSDQISTRGGGTIGNTSFMAAYLLFDIFFAILLFLSKRGAWQIFSAVSLFFMLPVLFTSSARGAIVSFVLGLFLLGLGYLIFSRKEVFRRIAWAIVLLMVIAAVAVIIFQPPLVKNEVTATLTQMKSRFVVWETGWQGFLERPILGWGPENFKDVFLKHFNSCMFLPECGSEIWFDRVHNIVLDTLVATGLVGFLSYLFVFGVAIGGLCLAIPKIIERRNIFIPLTLIVVLVVYFFQNLLVFDMINSYLVFFLTLALINFITQKPPAEEKKTASSKLNPAIVSAVLLVIAVAFWFGNIQPIAANHYVIKMVSSQNISEASLLFQKSLGSLMDKYEAREHFSQKMTGAGYRQIATEDEEAFRRAFELAQTEMEKSCQANSLDFRPCLFLGELYNSSYRFDGDKAKIQRGEEIMEKAIQLSPTNQQGYWNMAEIKLSLGKAEEMIALLQKAVELEPRLGDAHWYLAMGYQIVGEYRLALVEIKKAKESGYDWLSNPDSAKRAIEIINSAGEDALEFLAENDEEIVEYSLKILEIRPDDYNIWSQLAASYANLGQYDKAREAALKTKELNPDFGAQVEEFLKSLPQ